MSYDKIADQFSALRTTLQPVEVRYLDLILGPLKPGSTVLDLGCGTGRPIAAHVSSRGHQVLGVDASERMLAIAKKNLPGHRWVHADMESVELSGPFDAIICWDSLFHLPRANYSVVLRNAYRWLTAGGRLMVSSGGVVDESGHGFTDTMFGHEFYYDSPSPAQMTKLVEDIGFRIILAEMCSLPDGGNDKGKWATIVEKPFP